MPLRPWGSHSRIISGHGELWIRQRGYGDAEVSCRQEPSSRGAPKTRHAEVAAAVTAVLASLAAKIFCVTPRSRRRCR